MKKYSISVLTKHWFHIYYTDKLSVAMWIAKLKIWKIVKVIDLEPFDVIYYYNKDRV